MKKILIMLLCAVILLAANALAEATDYNLNICRQGENSMRITSDNAADVYGDGTVS